MLTSRLAMSAAGLVAGSVLLPVQPAAADPIIECYPNGTCRVVIETPGGPGDTVDPIGGPGGGGGGGGGDFVRPPSPGPGYWWDSYYGWTPPGITCVIPPPGAPGAPPADPIVTPALLAQQARDQLQMTAPQIGIVPESAPDSIGLVGAPVWMWTPEEQWDPLTATAAGGGLSVTAVAQISRVDWKMGDGERVTCTSAGTPYADHFGWADSPDCGHRYETTSTQQPDNQYVVEATAHWDITWSGAESGAMTMPLTATAPLQIGEMQVLVTR